MRLNFVYLENYPIFDQLQVEEALLRTDGQNWCIVNKGSPLSIVLGISSSPSELVYQERALKANIPLIQRFSGGGTVIVDEDTIFVSFIFERTAHAFDPYPEPILQWTESFYKQSLAIPGFHLRENDYAIGSHKIGGNAQYLRRDRWLHHTTFLWDYNPLHMEYLRHPPKAPNYRDGRSHSDFLTTLAPILPKEEFITRVKKGLQRDYTLHETTLPHLQSFPDHRRATRRLWNDPNLL